VQAIATSNDVISAQSPANQGYAFNWDYIYKYKNASSVAVDHYWILTAAHVADDTASGNLVIDGEAYTQREIVFHSTADLALVRYDKPFPGYYALHAGEIHDGQNGSRRTYYPLIMTGYGYPGAVASTTFTQSGSPGTKRWGTNRGVGESLVSANVGGTVGDVSTQCFKTTFSLSDTEHEAGGNVYDSGGPVFIEVDSEWKLTGINLYRSGDEPPYTGNSAAMIHDYIGWITNSIPDYDTDRDGLPDWWEARYGSGPTAMDAAADPDDDGFSSYSEWIADTDPTNALSHFRVLEWLAPTHVAFSSSADRWYQIEYRDNLADTNETWLIDVDWFAGSVSQTEQNVSGTTSNRFYRVRAKLR
jgi:hypothetical protein